MIKYGISTFFFLNVNNVIIQIKAKNKTLVIIPSVKLIPNECKHTPVIKSKIGPINTKIAIIILIFFLMKSFILSPISFNKIIT